MTAIVNGLGNEYKGRINVSIEDATKPANASRIHNEFGFRSHGLVIFGKNGEVERKMDGHMLQEPEIRSALESVLAGTPSESSGVSSGG